MRVPVWLTLGVAVLVCIFGAYRIRIAFRSDEEDQRARERKGLYAMGRRTHFLGGVIGPGSEPAVKDAAPSKPGSIPIDHLPPPRPTTDPAKPSN
jgi:hypothetical protein